MRKGSRATYCGTACRSAAYRRRCATEPKAPQSSLCQLDIPTVAAVRHLVPCEDVIGASAPALLTSGQARTLPEVCVVSESIDVGRFYRDLLWELGELASAGGTAIGAAAVVKRVALSHGLPVGGVPLPRLNRAELEEFGRRGVSRRRARGEL